MSEINKVEENANNFYTKMVKIKGFDGYYITEEGKVFCNLGKGRPTKGGYLRVCMRNLQTNKRVDKYIHRLVAEHFIPNPQNKRCVNHLDCNRTNNNVKNLEWATYKENNDYAIKLNRNNRDDLGRFCERSN